MNAPHVNMIRTEGSRQLLVTRFVGGDDYNWQSQMPDPVKPGPGSRIGCKHACDPVALLDGCPNSKV